MSLWNMLRSKKSFSIESITRTLSPVVRVGILRLTSVALADDLIWILLPPEGVSILRTSSANKTPLRLLISHSGIPEVCPWNARITKSQSLEATTVELPALPLFRYLYCRANYHTALVLPAPALAAGLAFSLAFCDLIPIWLTFLSKVGTGVPLGA